MFFKKLTLEQQKFHMHHTSHVTDSDSTALTMTHNDDDDF